MLIYNNQKEFIGIDEADLNLLGFSTLSDLRAEAEDFADMFVKTPGYVHNFKHVNWIDFVSCADSTESTKVIIHANAKNFRCLLDIKTAYLTDDSSSKAYLVYLSNIRELSDNENGNMSDEYSDKPTPTPIAEYMPAKEEAYEELIQELTPVKKEIIEEVPTESFDAPIDLDIPLEINFDDDIATTSSTIDYEEESLSDALKIDLEEDLVEEKEVQTVTTTEVFDNGYIFDPQVASDELGLPVDLIEEFIEDFIAQAKEFKGNLYTAFDNGDNDNIKIFSHKLKGVAANLRIEDALESLTIINTSDSNPEIKEQLDTLYKIISKLSGEKTEAKQSIKETPLKVPKVVIPQTEEESEETFNIESTSDLDELDIFTLPAQDKKEKPASIKDEDVPLKIDLPELADDNFSTHTDDFQIDIKEEDELSIEEDFIFDIVETDSVIDLEIEVPKTIEVSEAVSKPQIKEIQYDTSRIAGEIGLSQDHFMELFQDYILEAQDLSHLISKAIEEDNYIMWKNKAIQLKGMSDNMRINQLTKDLENLIHTQDTEIAKNFANSIVDSITALSKIQG